MPCRLLHGRKSKCWVTPIGGGGDGGGGVGVQRRPLRLDWLIHLPIHSHPKTKSPVFILSGRVKSGHEGGVRST